MIRQGEDIEQTLMHFSKEMAPPRNLKYYIHDFVIDLFLFLQDQGHSTNAFTASEIVSPQDARALNTYVVADLCFGFC